ncbi:MAG TPA: hypothetical protein DDW49_04720 [Deltaproteobacteria bacterium]|nr:MAG: hypothetical protein A2048_09480 [Deltaproteobacteria bacterium GWA2_45_12]HBF12681.1 hypothetical protein [Deltaproteobacteria bacterium]
MKYILFAITADRFSTEGFHWCLHTAKEKNKVVKAVYVASQTNATDYDHGKKMLEEVEKQCRTFQAPFEVQLEKGAYFQLCQDLASQPDVDILVVTEKKRSWLSKIFGSRESDQLRGKISSELKIYPSTKTRPLGAEIK